MCEENKYIRFDWAIKNILRDKANFAVLEGFISVLLGEKVTIVEILESEGNQANATDKFNRVDIKAKNSKDHIIIIEVQLSRQFYYFQRLLYGVSKAVTENIKLGQSYESVPKVYSISILYCEMGKGEDYLYKGTTVFTGVNKHDQLQISIKEEGVIKSIYPENYMPEYFLLRVNNFDKIPVTDLEEWMDYLKTGKIKEDTKTPGLNEAREKLQYLNMSDEERQAYDRHIDRIMVENDTFFTAREEGREKGCEEGREEEKVKMIRSMHENGIDIEMIATVSGMTAGDVRDILNYNFN